MFAVWNNAGRCANDTENCLYVEPSQAQMYRKTLNGKWRMPLRRFTWSALRRMKRTLSPRYLPGSVQITIAE